MAIVKKFRIISYKKKESFISLENISVSFNKNPNIINMDIVEASLTYINNDKLIIYSKEAIFNKETFKTTFKIQKNCNYDYYATKK